MKRDFLHITDFTTEEIWETLELSKWIKAKQKNNQVIKIYYYRTKIIAY